MPLDYGPDLSRQTPGVLQQIADYRPTVNDTYAIVAAPVQEAYTSVDATTWNPSDKGAACTLSGNNLIATFTTSAAAVRSTTSKSSGKWYWEITVTNGGSGTVFIGIANSSAGLTTDIGFDANGWSYASNGNAYNNAVGAAYGATYTTGDVIGVALDLSAGTLIFYKNGVSQGTAFTGLSGTLFAAASNDGANAMTVTANFGASTLGQTVPAGYSVFSGSDVIGCAIVKNNSGTSLMCAGTATKLYQTNGTTGWTDRSGKTYSATSWSFAQFGDKTIAANGGDTLQVATGGSFADIATAPAAKIVVVHENAVLAFNTSANPDGWYRSDTGDHTNWTVAAANDVDSGNLRGGVGGPIVAATVYGSYAIAWKSSAMYVGVFTGGAGGAADPKIRWDFAPGGKSIGCVGQDAHVETDVGIFFVSNRDIMLYDGGRPRSIARKVRKTFFASLVHRENIFLTHNEIERCIYIWYASSGTYPNKALIYNYETDKWGSLNTLSNATNLAMSYARCPVRDANYTDYTAVSGIATNSGLECNAVWVSPTNGSGTRLVNYAASAAATRNGGPSVTTGYFGNPAQDSTLQRVMVIEETGLATIPSTFTGFSYDSSLSNATSFSGTIDTLGHGDIVRQGRFFQCTFAWTSSAAAGQELKDLLPQLVPGGTA